MPLPDDEKLIAQSEDILKGFESVFGQHPAFRPAHAKGTLLTGTFTPTAEAATLSKAPHFSNSSTPVTVRFSSSTGLPLLPDNDPNGEPRGLAVRFHLGERVHTDIISHSTDGFPTRTGAEFLEFLKAIASSAPGTPSPTPVEAFVGSHPAALAFVQTPKPFPVSFATEAYFGVTAAEFVSGSGASQFFRYHIVPEAGLEHLDEDATATRGADYLFEEIKALIAAGPIVFTLKAQLAGVGDVVDDATIHWPADRPVVELGTITLTAPVADDAAEQKQIIFDPIPRVEGIEASNDPLLELRAAVYLISGKTPQESLERGGSMTEDLQYPIGKFVVPERIDSAALNAAIETLAEMPGQLREAVAPMSPAQLNTPYRDGGWTVLQVVHHIADSHANASIRVRLALTEEWPTIKAYDEKAWAELGDADAPVEWSLQIIENTHARWVCLLRALDEAQWQRGFVHPERGRSTLEQATLLYQWHAKHHLAHVVNLRKRMGW